MTKLLSCFLAVVLACPAATNIYKVNPANGSSVIAVPGTDVCTPGTCSNSVTGNVVVKNAASDYGAVCDGSTDDTTHLQNAINGVIAVVGALYIPAGKCLISSTLTINGPIQIYGPLNGVVCTDSAPWCGAQIYYTGTSSNGAIHVVGSGTVHRVFFNNLTISSSGGQGTADTGVFLDNVEESGFFQVNIGDYGGSGAQKKGFTRAIKTNHFAIGWIEKCTFEGDTYAFEVASGFVAGVWMRDNDFYSPSTTELAAVHITGTGNGNSNLHFSDSWLESVNSVLLVDSTGTTSMNAFSFEHIHDNTNGSSSAKLMQVTSASGSVTATAMSWRNNQADLDLASSFMDLNAQFSGDIALRDNVWFGGPSSVFSGSAHPIVYTSGNNFTALGSPTAPATVAKTGAGTSPTIALAGTNWAGKITLTTGSSPASNGVITTTSFTATLPQAPAEIVLTPGNAAAAALSGATGIYVSLAASDIWEFRCSSGALAASTQYIWYYHVRLPND